MKVSSDSENGRLAPRIPRVGIKAEALWLFRCCPDRRGGGKEYKPGIRHARMGRCKKKHVWVMLEK